VRDTCSVGTGVVEIQAGVISSITACAVMTATCISAVACGSSDAQSTPGSPSRSTPAATSSAPATTLEPSTGKAAALPLYGFHVRQVPGVPQPGASNPERHEWFLAFPEGLEWSGVLRMAYEGKRIGVLWGQAYKYTSDLDTHSLRLAAPAQVRGRRLGGTLRLGAFQCRRDEPATYTWARFERNYILRLTAAKEPCAIRRAVLEGDWQFID
jgi:hypothetical protein